ncbi:MAG: hypothetical protein IJ302_07825 [Clostridia bacterium]|nr:hypothetical protein [Clostridia bacterium]
MNTSQRFCAHRGLSALMPENTLPAFAAAIALGCDEIEFDVRLTADGALIVSHDDSLDRISDGTGALREKTLAELLTLNAGAKRGWSVPFCTAEEVFAQFANRTVFNMHLKEHGEDGYLIRTLAAIAKKYNAESSVYFAGSPSELYWMQRCAPQIPRTAIQLPGDTVGIYEMAKTYDCSGVQFWLGMFDRDLIDRLHCEEIRCNLFFADCDDDYTTYFDMGIDTLLTNRMDLAAHYRRSHT